MKEKENFNIPLFSLFMLRFDWLIENGKLRHFQANQSKVFMKNKKRDDEPKRFILKRRTVEIFVKR